MYIWHQSWLWLKFLAMEIAMELDLTIQFRFDHKVECRSRMLQV